jgi:hypothetical protein
MRRISILAGCAAALAAAATFAPRAVRADEATTGKAAVAMPKIAIDPMVKDVGTVAKGDRIEVVFNVKNEGNQDLVISDARPSCGCTVASFDRTVKPGATGKINASVDTKNFTGPITKVVSVVSNDPQHPQVNLTIKAVVKPYVNVSPQEFVRFSAVKGDTQSQDLLLSSTEKDFHPAIGESSQPYVKAEIQPLAESEKANVKAGETAYKLHVTLEPSAPVGVLNAPVRVKTGVAKQPEVEIRVAGIVRDRLSVTPLAVQFGNFTPGKDVISRNVVFTNNKPADPVRVTKVDTDVAGLTAELVPMTEGVNYTVVLKPKSDMKKGEFQGTLKIHTSDKDKPVIDVPVRGNAL